MTQPTHVALRKPKQHPSSSCHHCNQHVSKSSPTAPRGRILSTQINVPQLEVLAALESKLRLGLALDALQSQDNLLGGLGLLVEDRLSLTTVTGLLTVVTALSLGEQRGLASLVLGDLVLGVLAALLALAVGVSRLGNVDLERDRESVRRDRITKTFRDGGS